jgi:hypothetical protein
MTLSGKLKNNLHTYRISKKLDGNELIEALEQTYIRAARILEKLEVCTHLKFLDEEYIENLLNQNRREAYIQFWSSINTLLIFNLRNASESVMKLIEGISQSIGTKNELLFALSLRSLIEHSCILDDVKEKVEANRNFLPATIWESERRHSMKPLQGLIDLRKELMLFAVGHNIQLDTNIPDEHSSKKAWERFISSSRKVPDQFKVKNSVMHYIDRCTNRNHFFLLRYVYELLCEFCHPNMHARSLNFIPRNFGEAINFQNSPIEGFSYGFYYIFRLGQSIVPFITRRINVGFEVLDSCLNLCLH